MNNLLALPIQTRGFLWCVFLFLLCLVVVHAAKLSGIGYRTLHKTPPEKPQETPKAEPEPVYFIVEKKTKRPKAQYEKPKQVKFQ